MSNIAYVALPSVPMVRRLASLEEGRALHQWYGPNWAQQVLDDAAAAYEENRIHPLGEPTFGDSLASSKRAAFAAWNSINEFLHWVHQQ
jgi:hypothetical protein